ncbi:hypothetical protein D3C86_1711440 [compost metagenome]
MPHAACIAMGLEEIMVEHMQIDDAPDDRTDHQRQEQQHQAKPPGIERPFELDHGATMRTSAASGMRMFSCSLARVSMRL